MDIKLELLAAVLSDAVKTAIQYIDIDAEESINSVALSALNDIKKIIQDENLEDDIDVVEEIVCIFEKYNIDAGFRHDFG